MVSLVDFADRLRDARVLRSVTLNVGADALAVERVLARIHEELSVVEDCTEADVAVLRRVDCDVPILHVAALCAKFLSIFRVLCNLAAQKLDLLLVVIQAVAQVLLHVADFGLLREQVKKIFHLEHVIFADD